MSANGTVTTNIQLADVVTTSATRPVGVNIPVNIQIGQTYTAGTGANQIDKVAYLSGTAAATPTTIDLQTMDCLNGDVGFTTIRGIAVYNDSSTPTHALTIGPAASDGFLGPFGDASDRLVIDGSTTTTKSHVILSRPGTTAGWTVSSSLKNFVIDPGSDSVPFRVVVFGA